MCIETTDRDGNHVMDEASLKPFQTPDDRQLFLCRFSSWTRSDPASSATDQGMAWAKSSKRHYVTRCRRQENHKAERKINMQIWCGSIDLDGIHMKRMEILSVIDVRHAVSQSSNSKTEQRTRLGSSG